MTKNVRRWQSLVGWAAVGAAAIMGVSGAVASADPAYPSPPNPGYPGYPGYPATVTQTVTVAPQALGAAPVAPAPVAGVPAAPVPVAGAPVAPAPGPAVPGAPPAPAPSTLTPATSGTLRDYFAANGVQLEAQQPADFTALNITLPVPPGWTRVPDPNVPDAFAVIADRTSGSLYTPNAQVVVYRLAGQFDPKEAITHGFVDSQQLPAWRTTNASLADFGGFPSSLIEGTYRQGDMSVNTSQRHVVAAAGANSYLVSLTVNTDISTSVGHGPATDAIVNGFQVALPGAPVPAAAGPAAAAPPAAAGAAPAGPGAAPAASVTAPAGPGAAPAPPAPIQIGGTVAPRG